MPKNNRCQKTVEQICTVLTVPFAVSATSITANPSASSFAISLIQSSVLTPKYSGRYPKDKSYLASLVVLFSSSNRSLSLGDVVASLASTIAFPASRPATLDRRDPQPLVNSVLAFGATPILQRTLDQDRIKVRCVANQLSCRHYRGNTANRISSASHHGVGLISDLTSRRIRSQR
jgi:hypothetical protein